jgi:hypothetical protein
VSESLGTESLGSTLVSPEQEATRMAALSAIRVLGKFNFIDRCVSGVLKVAASKKKNGSFQKGIFI